MMAILGRLIVGGLWRPILKGLALVGLYAKGRVDQNARAKAKAQEETIEAHEVRNEVENRIARERDARERLRRDWSE